MHPLRIATAVLVLLIGGSDRLAAQSPADLPVDARFVATPLAEALRQLDRQLSLQLVFSPADLPDKPITASYAGAPLDGVLKDLLRDTPFGFFYYRDYAVVIGRHDLIERDFTAEYYRTLEDARTADAASGN